MDISEGESAQVKEEDATFLEIIDNDIKTEIVKKEARETVYFIKCEMCNQNSDETECVHVKNDGLGDIEQGDKLLVPSLCSEDDLHNNSFLEDVKYKVENTNSNSSQEKEYSILKLIDTEVTVKEEEYLDSPERLSTNMDFIKCETGEVKTEFDDIFCESVKIESVKEEPTDHEDSLSSGTLAQYEDSNEDIRPGSSKDPLKDCKTKPYRRKQVDKNKETFRCQVCSEPFFTRAQLEKHKVTHTKNERFHCTLCSKSYSALGDLVRHERTHTGKNLFTCKVCSKSFVKRGDLVTHGRSHTGEKPFNCKVCFKSFMTNSSLAVHGRTHTGEKPFNCEVCTKSFRVRCDLVRHRRTHTGEKPFNCEVCSKSFSKRGDLVIHGRTHSGEKPFKCKVCSKAFSTSCDLLRHGKTHTGEKPFKCKVCSKSFITRCDLVRHGRTHTGEKPFKCKVCSKALSTRGGLVIHGRTHRRKTIQL